MQNEVGGQGRRQLLAFDQLFLHAFGNHRHEAFGHGNRQLGPANHSGLDALPVAEIANHLLQRFLRNIGAFVGDQRRHRIFVLRFHQGLGNRFRHRRPLGDGHLFLGILAAHELDQVLIGQRLGELQDGHRHRGDILGQAYRHVAGDAGVLLEIVGQGLAHPHLGVLNHETENFFRQLALLVGQGAGIEPRRDLARRIRPRVSRRVRQ